MNFVLNLVRRPPPIEDIVFVLRVIFTRPGDLIGVIKREAARRRSRRNRPDKHGVMVLIESWEAALNADVLTSHPGAGPELRVSAPIVSLGEVVTELQFASAVAFEGLEMDPAFPALSLEAARLGLPQRATDPKAAAAARRSFIEKADIDQGLKPILERFAAEPIGAL